MITLDTIWTPEGKRYERKLVDGTSIGIAVAEQHGAGVRVRFFDDHHDEAKALIALNDDGFAYVSRWDTADYLVLAVAQEVVVL